MANNSNFPNTTVVYGHNFFVGNQLFKNDEQFRTGAEIKRLAGIDADNQLYLGVRPPWTDELICDNDAVDLTRPEIEHFFVKKKLRFIINEERFESDRQYISGRLVRLIGHVPLSQELFLAVQRPGEDEQIYDETLVDLARPGSEHFYSRDIHIKIVLIINGREKTWEQKKISYDQVIHLA